MPLFGPPNVERLRKKGDIRGLAKALCYDKDTHVCQAAADALVEIGGSVFDPLWRALVYQEKSAERTQRIVDVYLRINHPETAATLWGMFNRTNIEAAQNRILFEALVKIGIPAVSGAVRSHCTEFFTRIGEPAIDELIEIVTRRDPVIDDDPYAPFVDDWLLEVTIPLLAELGDARAVEPIISALDSPLDGEDSRVRNAAIEALAKIDDERSVDPLISVFSEYDMEKWARVGKWDRFKTPLNLSSAALRSILRRVSLSPEAEKMALSGAIPIPRITGSFQSRYIEHCALTEIPWEFGHTVHRHTFQIGIVAWYTGLRGVSGTKRAALAVAKRCFDSFYNATVACRTHQKVAQAKLGVLELADGNVSRAIDHFLTILTGGSTFYESIFEASFCLSEMLQAIGRQEEASALQALSDRAVIDAPEPATLQLPITRERIQQLVHDFVYLGVKRVDEEATERLDAFPEAWRQSSEHRDLLISIMASPYPAGQDCPYYQSGTCMFRVISRKDSSMGPERCSLPIGPYITCNVWQIDPGYSR